MIYEAVKDALLGLLRAPAHPPPPPAGSPGSVQTFRASKKFLYFKIATYLLGWVIPLGGLAAATIAAAADSDGGIALALLCLLVVAIVVCCVGAWLIRLEYDVRYYVVTDRAIRIREGIWTIKEITLTFANVQDLETRRGPIQQLLGIGDLFVRTAGGGGIVQPEAGGLVGLLVAQQQGGAGGLGRGHQAVFRGIDNAAEVRDRISALLKRYRDAGLGDPEDAHAHQPAPAVASTGGGLASPDAAALLREIRDGLRAYRERRADG